MKTRTSHSHPIWIDAAPCGSGQIGMTICPGKKGDSVYGAPWDRDLAMDLAAIVDWGASTLVTLMEDAELASLGAAGLGDEAEALGLDWHHLPIPDVSVPTMPFETLWAYSGHVLRKRLSEGERIVLHCRGGLGRTGLVAARLLIEFGADPAEAVRMVRAARKDAIETPEQEAFVGSLTQPVFHHGYTDRVLGCLLGGAVGDAFGYIVEFDRLPAIQRRFGPKGLQSPVFDRGKLVVSDDTQMTLFTAEGLLAAVEENGSLDAEAASEEIRQATLNWSRTQTKHYSDSARLSGLMRHRSLWKRRAPGNTCLSACRAGATGTPAEPLNDSKGCGGVMRVAPIGLSSALDSATAFDLAAHAAAQTHGHPSGYISAGVIAAIIGGLLEDNDPIDATDQAVSLARSWSNAEETVIAVELAQRLAAAGSTDHIENVQRIGEGWIGEEALAIGLYAVLVATDYADAVRIAANHDGDSDSTASIAGQIHGTWKGLDGIPNAWIRRLDVLEPTLEVADEMLKRCTDSKKRTKPISTI